MSVPRYRQGLGIPLPPYPTLTGSFVLQMLIILRSTPLLRALLVIRYLLSYEFLIQLLHSIYSYPDSCQTKCCLFVFIPAVKFWGKMPTLR